MKLGRYSFGIGDRFTRQGKAQLEALIRANQEGINIIPVWNKSNREHQIIGTVPEDTRKEADMATSSLGWKGDYFVDADHINLSTVTEYIACSDFFTIDVAGYIGQEAGQDAIERFMAENSKFIGDIRIAGIDEPLVITESLLQETASRFLLATEEAAKIYRYILQHKGSGSFITEVSMDEVEEPQNPVELLLILRMLSMAEVPVQTIAPKFTGRFNKGVDYAGDVGQFEKEFEQDLRVLDHAVREFGLPSGLKLSIHSGSDKFSLYPVIGNLIRKLDKGIHIKTAGTTWLEELIGLSEAGATGLEMVKRIYRLAYLRRTDLCAPYAAVININESNLPEPETVNGWDGSTLAQTLRHVPGHALYNPDFRQLLHVGYKVAAEMGEEWYHTLDQYAGTVAEHVTENIYSRHIKRIFD